LVYSLTGLAGVEFGRILQIQKKMKIAEVVSGTHKKDFLKVPKLLYKN